MLIFLPRLAGLAIPCTHVSAAATLERIEGAILFSGSTFCEQLCLAGASDAALTLSGRANRYLYVRKLEVVVGVRRKG